MARIVGVNIPDKKRMAIALTHIYGIGPSSARQILQKAGIAQGVKAAELKPKEMVKLKDIIEENFKIEGELRRAASMDIKRLKDIKSWRGSRHIKGLPVRGQTTRINSRTVRGNVRKTMGSGRKPPPAPK